MNVNYLDANKIPVPGQTKSRFYFYFTLDQRVVFFKRAIIFASNVGLPQNRQNFYYSHFFSERVPFKVIRALLTPLGENNTWMTLTGD